MAAASEKFEKLDGFLILSFLINFPKRRKEIYSILQLKTVKRPMIRQHISPAGVAF